MWLTDALHTRKVYNKINGANERELSTFNTFTSSRRRGVLEWVERLASPMTSSFPNLFRLALIYVSLFDILERLLFVYVRVLVYFRLQQLLLSSVLRSLVAVYLHLAFTVFSIFLRLIVVLQFVYPLQFSYPVCLSTVYFRGYFPMHHLFIYSFQRISGYIVNVCVYTVPISSRFIAVCINLQRTWLLYIYMATS